MADVPRITPHGLIEEYAEAVPDRALVVVEQIVAANGITWPALLTAWAEWCDEMAAKHGWRVADWSGERSKHLEQLTARAREIDAAKRAELSASAGTSDTPEKSQNMQVES